MTDPDPQRPFNPDDGIPAGETPYGGGDLDSVFSDDLPPDHRSGVVAVVGRPNVGKSSLINRILGQKIAIVSPRPQTTRRRQLGILTHDDAQMLFVDTPGLHAPQHRLGEYMVRNAESAFTETDAILLLLDVSVKPEIADQHLAETVARLRRGTPVMLGMNKSDLLTDADRDGLIAAHRALIPHDHAFLISATTGDGVPALIDHLKQMMPKGPRYYPVDQLSEVNLRFIAAETVREKIMLETEQEIPHAVAVEVTSYRERSDRLTYISAVIYCERESQKGIIIGKGGERIKKIGSLAREELRDSLGTDVYLELDVKVLRNWRSDETLMRRLGYRLKEDDDRR